MEHWTAKCTVADLVSEAKDARSVKPLRDVVTRLSSKPVTKMQGSFLNKHVVACDAVDILRKKDKLEGHSLGVMLALIAIVEERPLIGMDHLHWSEGISKNILLKTFSHYQGLKQWQGIVKIMQPWGCDSEHFTPTDPKLCHIRFADAKAFKPKAMLFRRIVVQELMCPMIYEGAPGRFQVGEVA